MLYRHLLTLAQSVGFAQEKGLRWRRRVNVVTTIHMAAALTSCRMAVVCTGQTIGYLVGANRHINQSLFQGNHFLYIL